MGAQMWRAVILTVAAGILLAGPVSPLADGHDGFGFVAPSDGCGKSARGPWQDQDLLRLETGPGQQRTPCRPLAATECGATQQLLTGVRGSIHRNYAGSPQSGLTLAASGRAPPRSQL